MRRTVVVLIVLLALMLWGGSTQAQTLPQPGSGGGAEDATLYLHRTETVAIGWLSIPADYVGEARMMMAVLDTDMVEESLGTRVLGEATYTVQEARNLGVDEARAYAFEGMEGAPMMVEGWLIIARKGADIYMVMAFALDADDIDEEAVWDLCRDLFADGTASPPPGFYEDGSGDAPVWRS